MLLNDMHHEMQ